jgi:hypothetical protein
MVEVVMNEEDAPYSLKSLVRMAAKRNEGRAPPTHQESKRARDDNVVDSAAPATRKVEAKKKRRRI